MLVAYLSTPIVDPVPHLYSTSRVTGKATLVFLIANAVAAPRLHRVQTEHTPGSRGGQLLSTST